MIRLTAERESLPVARIQVRTKWETEQWADRRPDFGHLPAGRSRLMGISPAKVSSASISVSKFCNSASSDRPVRKSDRRVVKKSEVMSSRRSSVTVDGIPRDFFGLASSAGFFVDGDSGYLDRVLGKEKAENEVVRGQSD